MARRTSRRRGGFAPTGATHMQEETQAPAAESQRIAIWSVSARMIGVYFAIFGVVCGVGIFAEVRSQLSQLSQGAPVDYLETALRIIKGSGSVGIGAASIALTIAIAWEGIMVLAQFVKRRQLAEGIRIGREQGLEQGIEIGVERGVEQGREQGIEIGVERGIERGVERGMEQGVKKGAKDAQQRHAKMMREWAAERGIPADELPAFDAPADSEDAAD